MMRSHMKANGLTGWHFTWDRAKTRNGATHGHTKTITLSEHFVRANEESVVLNTILHEIAHAMVGTGHGHNEVWRRQFIALGGNGRTRSQHGGNVQHAWTGKCPAGHDAGAFHRAPLRVRSCGKCSPRFSAANLIDWYQHGRKVAHTAMPDRYVREYLRTARV
jgi:predicted SprT family Zn-dependent metalloprotease